MREKSTDQTVEFHFMDTLKKLRRFAPIVFLLLINCGTFANIPSQIRSYVSFLECGTSTTKVSLMADGTQLLRDGCGNVTVIRSSLAGQAPSNNSVP